MTEKVSEMTFFLNARKSLCFLQFFFTSNTISKATRINFWGKFLFSTSTVKNIHANLREFGTVSINNYLGNMAVNGGIGDTLLYRVPL